MEESILLASSKALARDSGRITLVTVAEENITPKFLNYYNRKMEN